MATTRLSINGYGVRPSGSVAGKTETGAGHPVGNITRLGLSGHTARRTESFTGKTPDAGSGAHPVENITRLGLNGFMVRRGGSFAGREEVIVEPPEPTLPEIPGTGGGGRYEPGYTRQREDALKETRRRRILAEDEEISAMIMAMVTNGLL